jgi:hypothetical protein
MERAKLAGRSERTLLADYFSEVEASQELRQALRTLRLWRQRGLGPAWTKIGRKVFYARGACVAWLASQEHRPVRGSRR